MSKAKVQQVEVSEIISPSKLESNIAKFNPLLSKIESLNETHKHLFDIEIKDKETFKKVSSALSEFVSTRTGIESIRTEVKKEYLEAGRKIDSTAKEYSSMIEDGEKKLSKSKADYQAKLDAEKKRKAEEAEKKVKDRVQSLKDNGVEFNGSYYELDTISVDIVTITNFKDDEFDSLIKKAKEVKLEIDRLAKEEEERKIKEQEELESKRLENEKQAKELKKQALEVRSMFMDALFYELKEDKFVSKKDPLQTQNVDYVLGLNNEDFNSLKENLKSNNEKIDLKNELEKQRLADLEAVNKRTNALVKMGFIPNGSIYEFKNKGGYESVSLFDIQDLKLKIDFVALEKKILDYNEIHDSKVKQEAEDSLREKLALEKKKKAEAEAERKATLSDAKLYIEYIQELKNISIPEMKSKAHKNKVTQITNFLNEL